MFEVSRSHTHLVGLPCTSDQFIAQQTQETNINATRGIWTRDPSNQATADLCLRPLRHWSQNRHNTANQHLSEHTSPDTCGCI